MSNNLSQIRKPCLLLDLKKCRIRIHKSTLHLLGDPEYIQLLVNPKTPSIAVKRSSRLDRLSLHVRWNTIAQRQCFDFYSRYLLRSLQDLDCSMSDNKAYRLYGSVYTKENLAIFPIKNYINITTEETS